MSDIEQRLVDAECDAPRLSPKDIDANIKHVEYVKHVSHGGQILRWAVITTTNGFAVTGRPSASVSAENDRQDIGESVALENAKNELWPLMGYALKEKLYTAPPPRAKVVNADYVRDALTGGWRCRAVWSDDTFTLGGGLSQAAAAEVAYRQKYTD